MPFLNRRQFIRLNAAALAGAALAPAIVTGNEPDGDGRPVNEPDRSPAGFYRFDLGDLEVTVLSDGSFRLPAEHFGEEHHRGAINVDPQTREEYFRSRLVPADDAAIPASPVVLDFGDHRVLVDSGWGPGVEMAPDAGGLNSALEVAGISPESIDQVLLTHGHPDHLGGLLHPATGAPSFPNAEVVISDVELELWTADDAATRFQDTPILPLLPGIQEVLTALNDRIRTVQAGDDITRRIRSIPSPGHTPGHVAFEVKSEAKDLLLPGDSIFNIHAHFERPHWQHMIDMEPHRAVRSRRQLLDRAAGEQMLMLGFHFPFPGLGYALPDGEAYRWHPAGWRLLP